MILPSKHLPARRALLTVGAAALQHLAEPLTVSALWERLTRSTSEAAQQSYLRFDAFVLALDLLFGLGAIEVRNGVLTRAAS